MVADESWELSDLDCASNLSEAAKQRPVGTGKNRRQPLRIKSLQDNRVNRHPKKVTIPPVPWEDPEI